MPDSADLKEVLRILQRVPPSSALFRRCRELLNGSLEIRPPIPADTGSGPRRFLTIGMATSKDYDGVYFTIQAIRLGNPEIWHDVEFLVIDNDPAGPCAAPLQRLGNGWGNYRYLPYRSVQGTAVRDLVFRHAAGDFVLCVDSHVLFAPGALARLIEYWRQHPESNDLVHGTLVSDALEPTATHFEPKWSCGMYGVWGLDERGKDPNAPPFEIGMQGLGVFGCRRAAWPGFNPRLAGFGGEEGYIHEKIRRAGGRNLCLPFLRWLHRFERPMGIPYPCNWADRIRNYLLIHDELGRDPTPVIDHFEEHLGKEAAQAEIRTVQAELSSPYHFFDAVYCISADGRADRWERMRERFRELGIERLVRRFYGADTPWNRHIGCALSHRRIIAEARHQRLETVVVFDDDYPCHLPDAGEVALSISEMQEAEWQLSLLSGSAIAYHHTVYDAILGSLPDDPIEVALQVAAFDERSGQTMQQLFRQFGLRQRMSPVSRSLFRQQQTSSSGEYVSAQASLTIPAI